MTAIQFIIILIVGFAILLAILFIGLFCRDKPCRLLRSVWPWATNLFKRD